MTRHHDEVRAPSARGSTSLADMVVEADAVPLGLRFPPAARVKVAVLAGLFVLLNAWQFRPLVNAWLHDENWGHGFVIPLFSLYLLYRRGDELFAAPRRACLGGLAILLAGIVSMIVGFYPIGMGWLSQLSMSVVLFGLVLYLGGPGVAKLVWLPIFYLCFAMPIPRMLYTRLATPLQELAAQSACLLLKLFGARIEIAASHLEIVSTSGRAYDLTVVEACSGVRSLIAYVALGVAWAYLEARPIWQRLVLVLAAVPIALLCNIFRVAATCWMFVIDRPELGRDFMHKFMGLAMLLPAVVLFWLLGLLLQRLWVEEDAEDFRGPSAGENAEARASHSRDTRDARDRRRGLCCCEEKEESPASPASLRRVRGVFRDRHFMVAATVLAVSAAGWGMTIRLLKWVTYKEPVPWVRAVRVDPDNRRLLTLPERFGPYVMPDGKGEIVHDDITLELLGIKTAYDDRGRVARRRSNWYVARVYRDSRPGAGPRTWQLSVYYYTGGLDKVPHVPERCLVADGARWLDSRSVPFEAPGARPPWDGQVGFRRALFARDGGKFVQYYLFSLNGRPETSWEVIRATLSLSPWMRHCYFAKIQFAPTGAITHVEQTDRAAGEFAKHFLPEVLKMLPMPDDVRKLSGQ